MKFLKKSTLRSSQVSLNRCCIESLFLSKISQVEYHPLWRNSSIPGNHWTSYWLPVENFSATLSNFHPTGIFRQRDDSLFHWNLSVSLEELFHRSWKVKIKSDFTVWPVSLRKRSINIHFLNFHLPVNSPVHDKSCSIISKLIAIPGNEVKKFVKN